jgi:adenine-specific DNA-methyltransferase
LSQFKIKTVSYKGSKRKLLSSIVELAREVNAESVFDGFSGTGIVSATLRNEGYVVSGCDLNFSSYVFGKVFLEGYNPQIVEKHLDVMNGLSPIDGWLSQNYSGVVTRKVRGTGTVAQRPLGLLDSNATKIDAARDYIESISNISEQDKNALIFSTIRGADSVFNNSNDQKSSFKEWSPKSQKDVLFEAPTLVSGPSGSQYCGDIFSLDIPEKDFVYLDPPYTHGVLYAACYHLNDSIAMWDKPELDHGYAVPRPSRAAFRTKSAGSFYGKKTASYDFDRLLSKFKGKRTVLSYSDAPRNCINIADLVKICKNHGKVKVNDTEHIYCTQYISHNKRSTILNEFFIIIDN